MFLFGLLFRGYFFLICQKLKNEILKKKYLKIEFLSISSFKKKLHVATCFFVVLSFVTRRKFHVYSLF